MKGSIRFFVGFLLTFGAVGGMENGTDAQLPLQLAIAVVGMISMYSGARALKESV